MRLPTAAVRRSVQLASWPVTGSGASFARQRQIYRVAGAASRPPRGTTVLAETHGGVACDRVIAAGADPTRSIVHFHGGGFCIGSPKGHRSFAGFLSQAAGCAVVLPDYRLAPEHVYPAAHDDAERVWRALADEANIISGDSAGGNLALSVCLRMRDLAGPRPKAAVLISPGLDRSADRRADAALVRSDIMLTPDWLDSCFSAYSGHEPDAPEMRLLDANLADLPPMLVIAGTDELLLPDADRFSTLARNAGVEVSDIRGKGLWHIYPTQAGLLREADEAVTRIAEFVVAAG